jgi:cobyrinic acid a,c-diamide synthase
VVAIARLVVAAPASGCGKTTVACGLMAALRARGLAVSGHKVGPDYIDPGYHALATGRPPRNLDPFLCGEDLIAPLFLHGAAGAELAVVEGVMGLFDGADPATVPGQEPGFGSTAHVARLLGAPVVLVVDAARAGRSVAALAAGFAAFDRRISVAGVILNRVASDRHDRLLRDALAGSGITVYGAIRRTEGIVTPSRHLGLIPVAERAAVAGQAIAATGDLIAGSCDLDALLALARRAPDLPGPPWDPAVALSAVPAGSHHVPAASPPVPVVAVAGGAAFTFGYTEQCELLEAAGARVASFDPLRDEDLPEGTTGLILGGGFPEVHAAELSANERLRSRVATLARQGTPLAAECAGLLYLAQTLDGRPMCGVLDLRATMTGQLTLGYRHAVAVHDSVLAQAGDRVRGHEFHRTTVVPASGARAAWRFGSGELEGHLTASGVASYLHTHWAGHPAMAARFAAACRPATSAASRAANSATGAAAASPADQAAAR